MTAGALAGQVAVVTGGAGGIGRATAEELARLGARVAIVDIDDARATETAGQIVGARGFAADVTDTASVAQCVSAIMEEFRSIDILVNNAGITRDNLIFRMTDEDWDSVISVHLRGAFVLSRAIQKIMVAQRAGRIINVSSIASGGNRGQSNYSAAKAGLEGFTRTLAVELGPFGIAVNAVRPGFISTAMTDATARRVGMEPDVYRAQTADVTPLRRVGEPADIASAVAFLSGQESSFITGQVLTVDGGLSL